MRASLILAYVVPLLISITSAAPIAEGTVSQNLVVPEEAVNVGFTEEDDEEFTEPHLVARAVKFWEEDDHNTAEDDSLLKRRDPAVKPKVPAVKPASPAVKPAAPAPAVKPVQTKPAAVKTTPAAQPTKATATPAVQTSKAAPASATKSATPSSSPSAAACSINRKLNRRVGGGSTAPANCDPTLESLATEADYTRVYNDHLLTEAVAVAKLKGCLPADKTLFYTSGVLGFKEAVVLPYAKEHGMYTLKPAIDKCFNDNGVTWKRYLKATEAMETLLKARYKQQTRRDITKSAAKNQMTPIRNKIKTEWMDRLSGALASGSSGTVQVMTIFGKEGVAYTGSTWARIEYPRCQRNAAITSIQNVEMEESGANLVPKKTTVLKK